LNLNIWEKSTSSLALFVCKVSKKLKISKCDMQNYFDKLHSGLYARVTPSFKGKTECIDHVCARIKLHTRLDIMNTKISATRIKSYYKP
jgi:hypothetical protein